MGDSLRPYAFFYILRIFPHSTPCMQLSSHTAFHRSIAPTKGHSSVPVTGTSSVRPSLFSTDSATYFLRLLILSNSIPFLVPITLSVHISLGACYGSGSCFDGLSHTGDYLTILPTHIAVRTEILYFTGSSVRWERTYSPWIFYRPPAYQTATWVAFLPPLPSFWPISFRLHTPVGDQGKPYGLLSYQFSYSCE